MTATAMAGDIKKAAGSGEITASETAKLGGILADITGDAGLAEAYINNSIEETNKDVSDNIDSKEVKGDNRSRKLADNRKQGRNYEIQEYATFIKGKTHAAEQITIKTVSARTRLDAIGLDEGGFIVINEFKSSSTAPLTYNQNIAFPELYESGGVVVGKGKGIFKGGYEIPIGTNVKIIRPEK